MNCKNCSTKYDSSDHKPIVLFDCVHTFCINCVSNISSCPLCKQEIKSQTVNWDMLELIEEGVVEITTNQNENKIINESKPKKANKEKQNKNKTNNKQQIDQFNRLLAMKEFEEGEKTFQFLMHYKAIEHYDKGIKADPTYIDNYMRKAYVLGCIFKYDEVVECYNQAIKYIPDSYEAHFNKAEALMALKKYREAIDEFNHALQIDPSQSEAMSNKQLCLKKLKENRY